MVSKIMGRLGHLFKLTVTIVFLLSGFAGCQKPEICMRGIRDDFVLDEALAISLSRNTLIRSGIEVSKMAPVPYGDDPKKFFARNLYDPNSGYVLWDEIGEGASSKYSVSIRKKGDKIYCAAEKGL